MAAKVREINETEEDFWKNLVEKCLTLKNVESKTTFKWRKLKNLTC